MTRWERDAAVYADEGWVASGPARVGAALRRAREERRLTLEDVERSIRFTARQLRAVEEGGGPDLPPQPYTRVAVVAYASLLGLDGEAAAQEWGRGSADDDGGRRSIFRVPVRSRSSWRDWAVPLACACGTTAYLALGPVFRPPSVELPEPQGRRPAPLPEPQPAPEVLAIVEAQLELARATRRSAQDQYDKQSRLFDIDHRSVSKDALDSAANALQVATANVEVAQRQLALTRAGAWSHDIANQQRQYDALRHAHLASEAQLAKYTLRAPVDGVILSVRAAVGSYVSPQGTYSTYTGGFAPLLVMGGPQDFLAVRCYIDETLIHRLPEPSRLSARMFVRGSSVSLPLEYVRTQPYVSPKVSLSDQRTERVDVRVLPLIFRFLMFSFLRRVVVWHDQTFQCGVLLVRLVAHPHRDDHLARGRDQVQIFVVEYLLCPVARLIRQKAKCECACHASD